MVEHFTLTYDGPALVEHRMPAADLGPALVAIAEIFQVAHRTTSDGATPPPSLDIVANRGGSFAIDLLLSSGEDAVDLLLSREAVAGATALALLKPVVDAMRWLGRRLRHGRQRETVEVLRPGQLRVRWEADGSTEILTTSAAQDLVESMDFRRTLAAATSPIRQNRGIDSLKIEPTHESADLPAVMLDRQDAVGLDEPIEGEDMILTESERQVVLRPVKPALQSGFKWFVSDGSSNFWISTLR